MTPRATFAALAAVVGVTAGGAVCAAEAPPDKVEGSVVKVFATKRLPDPYQPWTKKSPTDVTGSGVVIEGNRILTNAHVVTYASQVQIQANQAGDKISATVAAIAPDIDLAVLTLDDPKFFDAHKPLARRSALPEIKDTVLVYGYPTGGSSLSITKGIVSRIEFAPYKLFSSGLRIQIDAAVNPGNSGGPAVSGDTMVGLVFSSLGGADNIAYIIPCEEVDLFLKDVEDGRYDGKPVVPVEFQTLENDALRSRLKLDAKTEGIVVHDAAADGPDSPLREWDVITKIGETSVDDQGMVALTPTLRVRFLYRVQRDAKNGVLPLTIIRDGKEMHLDLPVRPRRPSVIPELSADYPSYFIYGPLSFSNASMEFVIGLSASGAGPSALLNVATGPLMKRLLDPAASPGEALVVVSSPFFPHNIAKGYGNPKARVVRSVNGTPIKNLAHLVAVLRDLTDEFVTFEFEGRDGESLVFRRKEMTQATDDVLTDNGVRSQGSPDVLAIWNGSSKPKN
jgi:S1-C subfamily serine protease